MPPGYTCAPAAGSLRGQQRPKRTGTIYMIPVCSWHQLIIDSGNSFGGFAVSVVAEMQVLKLLRVVEMTMAEIEHPTSAQLFVHCLPLRLHIRFGRVDGHPRRTLGHSVVTPRDGLAVVCRPDDATGACIRFRRWSVGYPFAHGRSPFALAMAARRR
jgi:hypothetical protein